MRENVNLTVRSELECYSRVFAVNFSSKNMKYENVWVRFYSSFVSAKDSFEKYLFHLMVLQPLTNRNNRITNELSIE